MSNKHPSSDGLRRLADWLGQCAAAGLDTGYQGMDGVQVTFIPGDAPETVRAFAQQMGSFTKDYSCDSQVWLIKDFDGAKVRLVFNRTTVCKRVVTGTKTIPAVTIPAKPAEPERVIPEQTVETVEWQCGESLLAKTFDELEASA
ncbi:MAG TPA: hypothetical protein DDW98_08925 [Gammaproteobacteria bacterium]|nr:hypothetical protein [Gammaproteobacteria bacterium]